MRDWPWTSSSAQPASAAGRTSALLWQSLSSHLPRPTKIGPLKTHTHTHINAFATKTETHLVKEVVDSKLVVIEQDLLFCSEEPLAQGEAGSWDGWGIVLYIQFVGEFVGGKLTHWRRNRQTKGREGERELYHMARKQCSKSVLSWRPSLSKLMFLYWLSACSKDEL